MPWELTGNSNIDPANNFLGTTENQPLAIRTNQVERMRITTAGSVGIGTPNPGAKLEINDGDLLFKATARPGEDVEIITSRVGENAGDIIFQSAGGGEKGRIWSNREPGAGLYLSGGGGTPHISITAGGNITAGTEVGLFGGFRNAAKLSVWSSGSNNFAVHGVANDSHGVVGRTLHQWGSGVVGTNHVPQGESGVLGFGLRAIGVYGGSVNGAGVVGVTAYGRHAAQFFGGVLVSGDVEVTGNVTVTGHITKPGGGFKIDHPLAAANMYLNHSFVESDEMKNLYDGVVECDNDGAAVVHLPEWFKELNRDVRYQLTAIGAAAPELHIVEEISAEDSSFKIAGGESGMKVCWQVTGIRKDKWAEANPLAVDQEKPEEEQGRYLHPELYGESEDRGIGRPSRAVRQRQMQAMERLRPTEGQE